MNNINFENIYNQLEGKLSFNFGSVKKVIDIEINDIPETSLAILLQYGTQKLNDYVNSAFAKKGNEKTREELIEEAIDNLKNGNLNKRQYTTSGVASFRDFILSFFKGKIDSKILSDLKSATPERILQTLYPTDENKREIVAEKLQARYQQHLALLRENLDDFILPDNVLGKD